MTYFHEKLVKDTQSVVNQIFDEYSTYGKR